MLISGGHISNRSICCLFFACGALMLSYEYTVHVLYQDSEQNSFHKPYGTFQFAHAVRMRS